MDEALQLPISVTLRFSGKILGSAVSGHHHDLAMTLVMDYVKWGVTDFYPIPAGCKLVWNRVHNNSITTDEPIFYCATSDGALFALQSTLVQVAQIECISQSSDSERIVSLVRHGVDTQYLEYTTSLYAKHDLTCSPSDTVENSRKLKNKFRFIEDLPIFAPDILRLKGIHTEMLCAALGNMLASYYSYSFVLRYRPGRHCNASRVISSCNYAYNSTEEAKGDYVRRLRKTASDSPAYVYPTLNVPVRSIIEVEEDGTQKRAILGVVTLNNFEDTWSENRTEGSI